MAIKIDEETIDQTLDVLFGYAKDLQEQVKILQDNWFLGIFTVVKQSKLISEQRQVIKKIEWIQEKRQLNIEDLKLELEKTREMLND